MSIPSLDKSLSPLSTTDKAEDGYRILPDFNQLSVLVGSVMLVYALLPFLSAPGRYYSLQLPGVYLEYELSISTIASILVAALAASGINWLLHDHPSQSQNGKKFNLFQHSILPALTAWAIGVPLQILEIGIQWWVVFALGGVLLSIVFISEYIAFDIADPHHVPASIALTSVSYALLFILSVALRSGGFRLYLILPALFITVFFISLRSIYLGTGKWSPVWSLVIAIIIGQLIIAFHYMPLTSIKFGMLILGPAYALSSMAGAQVEGQEWTKTWLEPALMLIAFIILAFVVRV